MHQIVSKEIKKFQKNGKILSFRKWDSKEGVKHIMSSCFVEDYNVIIRGECWNKSSRDSFIMANDRFTKELRGKLHWDFYI